MNTLSSTDICILLVDPDPTSSIRTLALLLDNNYRVVTAFGGADALETLQNKKRKVDLMLMSSQLPDMCAVEVLDIVESKYNMAVVMVFDTYQPDAMMEFLQNGAIFCITKPLDSRVVAKLWRHSIVKKTEAHRLSFMGLTPSFTWTPSLEGKFLTIVGTLGDHDTAPVEVLRRMSVPGLTLNLVMEKLQEYQERQNLQFNSMSVSPTPAGLFDQNALDQFMDQDIHPGQEFTHELGHHDTGFLQNPREDELNGARCFNMLAPPAGLVPVLPEMSQLPQASMPPADIAQMLVQPPWSSAPTDVPSSSMAPLAPGNGEDESERGD